MDSSFDYVIVGGGTAGSVLAARLSEDPDVSVALLEWGPSDEHEERALLLRRWIDMIGSEYDLSYASVEQPNGNSALRTARGRILGGTSTLNTMVGWCPLPSDLDAWRDLGVSGWDFETFAAYRDQVQAKFIPVPDDLRSDCIDAAIEAASHALDLPVRRDWPRRQFATGVGYLDLGYDPETGARSSASSSYLHGVHAGRPNLRLVLSTRAMSIEVVDGRATAVVGSAEDGSSVRLTARREIVVSCGAIDTPRLLLLSGIGPAAHLREVGVPVVVDAPGVGENLMDHAEGLVLFELNCPTPQDWPPPMDAMAFMAPVSDGEVAPEVFTHVFRYGYGADELLSPLGYSIPRDLLSMTPNVARPKSRGQVRLASGDPEVPPLLDYRYFTDPDGYDERILVAGARMARQVAAAEPLASLIEREVFPGPEAQTDEELSRLLRAVHGSVCHASGTCRMGASGDPLAVVDSRLRVQGLDGLRIADASIFPTVPAFNPMVTVLMVAEHAAAMVKADAGL